MFFIVLLGLQNYSLSVIIHHFCTDFYKKVVTSHRLANYSLSLHDDFSGLKNKRNFQKKQII